MRISDWSSDVCSSDLDFVVPKIKAYNYFDLAGSYDVTERFSLRGGINNLFDKQPPVVGNDYGGTTENSGNTYPAAYDPLGRAFFVGATVSRSEEHTSELQSLMRISYAVFCLKKKKKKNKSTPPHITFIVNN